MWLKVMNSLRNRWVEDIVIAVIDGHRSLSADERADLHRQFSRYCLSVLRLERAAGSGSVRP